MTDQNVSASVTARVSALEARCEQLQDEIEDLAGQREAKLNELHAVQADLSRVRDKARGKLAAEEVRDVVARLGTFTLNELASELGVPAPKVKKHLDAYLVGGTVVELTFRAFGKKTYEYQAPTDAGAAFLAQQRLRLVEPTPQEQALATAVLPERGEAVEGTGKTALDGIPNRDLRKVAKDAAARGWELHRRGDGKYDLRKVIDGMTMRVTMPTTPKNPTQAAIIVRENLSRCERGVA